MQPYVKLLLYDVAGITADIKPYLDLSGNATLNPLTADLDLTYGADFDLSLDLSVFDGALSDLPTITVPIVAPRMIWQTNYPPAGLSIVVQPLSTSASIGSAATFNVLAKGPSGIQYQWLKNGLNLADDTRIAGSRTSTLRIASVELGDAGVYTVRVSCQSMAADSDKATLAVDNGAAGMALIPAGSFTMGNSMDPSEGESDELPLHTVYVSAFYMDQNLVTYSLWQQVYQWAINHGYSFDNPGAGKAANHPVQGINWYDAVKWCNARSEMEVRRPAYYMDGSLTTTYRSGQVAPFVNWSSGYRLPTEAEWEKAARGGLVGHRFPWGDTISESQANYFADPVHYAYDLGPSGFNAAFNDGVTPYTSPVGYFTANGYNLFDMAGNVWQWCWDWYAPYASGSQTNPAGPASGGPYRVFRAGRWDAIPYDCRTSDRGGKTPDGSGNYLGFRSVLP